MNKATEEARNVDKAWEYKPQTASKSEAELVGAVEGGIVDVASKTVLGALLGAGTGFMAGLAMGKPIEFTVGGGLTGGGVGFLKGAVDYWNHLKSRGI